MNNDTSGSHYTSRSRVQASDDPGRIEQQIDQKRADISSTLEQLEAQISPNHVMGQGLGIVREHGGDLLRKMGHTYRDNPAPFIVSGVALAWLALSASSRRDTARTSDAGNANQHAVPDLWRGSGESANRMPGMTHNDYDSHHDSDIHELSLNDADANLLDELADALENLSSTTVDLKDDTKAKYEALRAQASRQSHTLRHAAKERADLISDKVSQVKSGTVDSAADARRYIQSQPLMAGLISFAIGAVLGSLVPKSHVETQATDNKGDDAKGTGSSQSRDQ